MNENEQCVECGETEVYLIDGEVCQDCDDALYDDAF
jgi:NMD protein affecting ribosome stability and mRNA decay